MTTTRAVLTASLFALLLAACSQPQTSDPITGREPMTPIELPDLMSTGVADEATDVVVTPSGDALVVGLNGTGGEPSNRLFVRRYSSEGDLRWTRELDHCRNPRLVAGEIEEGALLACDDRNVKVATDGAGNAYVLSQTYEERAYCCNVVRTYLSKFGAAGRPLWDKQLEAYTSYVDGPMSGRTGHFVTDFTVNKMGEAFLIAPGAAPLGGAGSSDPSQLAKFSSTGERLWDISPAAADLEQVASDGQGSVFVLGKSGLHKFAADGAALWQRDLTFSSEFYDNTELVVAGDHHVYGITGTSYLNATEGYSDGKVAVVKFNAQGELLWQTVLGPEPFLGFNAAAVDASGRLYFVGTGDVLSETLPRYLVHVSPDGALDGLQQLDFGERGGLLTHLEIPLAIAVGATPNDPGATRAYIAGLWGQPNSGSASQDAFLYRADVDIEQSEAGGVWVQY